MWKISEISLEMDIVSSNIVIAFICQYIMQPYHRTCFLLLKCALHVMLIHVCVPTIHHAAIHQMDMYEDCSNVVGPELLH